MTPVSTIIHRTPAIPIWASAAWPAPSGSTNSNANARKRYWSNIAQLEPSFFPILLFAKLPNRSPAWVPMLRRIPVASRPGMNADSTPAITKPDASPNARPRTVLCLPNIGLPRSFLPLSSGAPPPNTTGAPFATHAGSMNMSGNTRAL
ncbi:Uncharacterised protein [uncultured archaeon]|nr:Uncharacterised protein [uncultured archaeon]